MVSSFQISQLNKQRISVESEKNSCFVSGKNEIYYFTCLNVITNLKLLEHERLDNNWNSFLQYTHFDQKNF